MSPGASRIFRISFWLLLLFLAGMSVGIIGTKIYLQRAIRDIFTRGPDAIIPMGIEVLSREAGLRPEQRGQAMEILLDAHMENYRIRRAVDPQQRELIKKTATRLHEILDDDQKKLFNLDEILRSVNERLESGSDIVTNEERRKALIQQAIDG